MLQEGEFGQWIICIITVVAPGGAQSAEESSGLPICHLLLYFGNLNRLWVGSEEGEGFGHRVGGPVQLRQGFFTHSL